MSVISYQGTLSLGYRSLGKSSAGSANTSKRRENRSSKCRVGAVQPHQEDCLTYALMSVPASCTGPSGTCAHGHHTDCSGVMACQVSFTFVQSVNHLAGFFSVMGILFQQVWSHPRSKQSLDGRTGGGALQCPK